MHDASVPIEKAGDEAKRAEDQGVKPDQRIENKVGAQLAKQAIFSTWNRVRTLPRPDSCYRWRILRFHLSAAHLIDG